MSLVMDFLEHALPTVGAVGGGILGEAIDPLGGGIIGAGLGSALGQAGENKLEGKSLGSNILQAGLGGAVGQGVGGLAAKGIEGLAPGLGQATGIVGKAAAGAVKGAAVGGTASTAAAIASGQPVNAKNLTMDFLQGAGTGAATGGLLGGGAEAYRTRTPLNEGGYIGGRLATSFDEHQLTGTTFKGYNTTPSFEADDSQAIVTPPDKAFKDLQAKGQIQPGEALKLDEVLNHPTLFKDYPQLANINVKTVDPSNPKLMGGFNNKTDTIYINKSIANDPEELKNTLLHETQHAIQSVERYPNVGTPSTLARGYDAYAQNPIEQEAFTVGDRADMTPEQRLANPVSPAQHIFTDNQFIKLAKSNNPSDISKQLSDQLGPVVAAKIAPTVAATDDPHVVRNAVDNALNQHLASATPDPSQLPVTPSTPTSDVNTPQQMNQQATQAGSDFINAPGTTSQPSQVGNLAAVSGMHDIINQGGTVDQALSHYMENTGSDIGTAKAAFNKLLKDSGRGGSLKQGMINASLNPEFEKASSLLPEVQKGDIQQPVKNAQATRNEVIRRGQTASDAVKQLSSHDLKLMDQLRGNDPQALAKQAENPEAFMQAANAVKKYNDFTQGAGSAFLGQDVAYRQNYGAPLLFDQSPENQQAMQAGVAKLPTKPGYGKARTFDSYDQAAEFGVKRQNEHFGQDLEADIAKRSNDLSQLALSKGFEEAFPGQVKVGQIGTGEGGIYKQLLTPGGSKISLPANIANQINEREPAPDARGFIKGYDQLNSNWKNLKLAGGGFHSLNVMGTYIAQQIASGKFFSHPEDTLGMIRSTLSESAFKGDVQQWGDSGRLLDMDAAGLEYNALSSQGDIAPSGKLGNIPVLKQIHESIFGRQIPYMKMKIFDQLTQGMDRNNPDDLANMTKVAKELNQNFGGMNRAIQGLTPRQFKVASRVFLATDYNEGQIRSLVDAFSKGGADGKLARQVVFGKALLFAGMATAGGAIGGEFKGQTPKQIAFNILEKTVNPEFKFGDYNVGLPTTQLSELGKPALQTGEAINNGTNAKNPAKDFFAARLASVPSAGEQLLGNRSFSGNAIYGTDYNGRPISPEQTASTVASAALPIPAAQGIQTATGKQSVGASIANTIGLRVNPSYNLQYAPIAGQTYVQRLEQAGAPAEQVQADTKFFDLLGTVAKSKSKVVTQAITDLKAKGDTAAAQAKIDAYNQKLVAALQPWQQSGGNKYFDSTMLQLLQSSMIKMGSVNRSANYDIKTNPTKYGVPIGPLASQPATTKTY